jgi:hypothetical protein
MASAAAVSLVLGADAMRMIGKSGNASRSPLVMV